MKKKILSLAIAICMVAAMLPSMVFSAGAETVNAEYRIVYEFSNKPTGVADSNLTKKPISAFSYANTAGLFEFFASSYTSASQDIWAGDTILRLSTGGWVAFKLRVPVENIYNLSLFTNNHTDNKATVFKAYLTPLKHYPNLSSDNISAAKTHPDTKQLATADYTGTTNTVNAKYFTTSGVNLTAEEYILIIEANDIVRILGFVLSTSGAKNNVGTSGLVDNGDSSIYTGILSVEGDVTILEKGESVQASAKLYKVADGYNGVRSVAHNKALVDESKIIYESNDPSVATVDAETGVVTAVGVGTATITAKPADVTYGSVIGATITIPEPEVIMPEYRIIYDFGNGNNGGSAIPATIPGTSTKPTTNDIAYTDTWGLWEYHASAGAVSGQVQGNRSDLYTTSTNTWYALKIRVPVSNTYKITYVKYQYKANGGYGVGDVYFLKLTDELRQLTNDNVSSAMSVDNKIFADVDYDQTANNAGTALVGTLSEARTLDAGEYIVVFNATGRSKANTSGTGYNQSPAAIILSTSGAQNTTNGSVYDKDTPIYTGTVAVNKSKLLIGENSNAEATIYTVADAYYAGTRNYGNNKKAITTDMIFESSNPSVATVDETSGEITAISEGTTVITAELTDGTMGSTVGAILMVVKPDEQFTNEFTGENGYTEDENKAFTEAKTKANFYSAVVGGTVEMNETTLLKADTDVALGTQYSYTAPTKEGYTFRYWAKALTDEKLIVTRNATVKFMPTTETTNLVAVYEPENGATVTGESFYNANGQLLTDVKISAEKMPPLPSMTGYGTASAWVQYGTGTEFAEGADAPTENLMFVAKYAEPTETFVINVEGGSGTGNYAYGQEVTCTAEVPTGKVFKCWTKTPVGGTAKIISLDEEYTFNAWESCTITAVFADEEPVFTGNKFSIILRKMTEKVGGNTAYMAEFVGLENAVEKGIKFGTKRVAMTTDAAQFTVVNDTTVTDITGYAILSDGTVIYDK
ncbi:MAG: Ig-like domain-containing protein [Oscillospiraceae bacterium]|nr:Ig-like domain-containing protein [Oscillospiraceae bacterium]